MIAQTEREVQPTVFVVDDDPGVRNSLSTLLQSIHLAVETYDTAQGFLKHVDPSRPGCLILDLRMPSTTGIELQARLTERKFTLPHIFITAYGDVPTAVHAMHAGAFYFLEKPYRPAELIEHIHRALAEDARHRDRQRREVEARARAQQLTLRERQVAAGLVRGLPNKVIADELQIARKTVDIHRKRALDKLGVDNVANLVRLSLEHDLCFDSDA
jgi:two-component system, LuxR family, response regulator FixJ